jgi:hypothetical protein
MSEALQIRNDFNDLCIITPDLFDNFQLSVFTWYQECSNDDESPPNLFAIFEGSSGYSQMLFDVFIDGFSLRYHADFGRPHPYSPMFTHDDRQFLAASFIRNFNRLHDQMVSDFRFVLDMFNLNYVWDTSILGGEIWVQRHCPIIQIW